ALGALEDLDRAEFEAHLLECDECDDEVRSFGRVATLLAFSVPPVDPGAAARGRVIDIATRAPASARPSGRAPWLLAAASVVLAVALGAYAWSLRQRAAQAQF